MKVRSFNCDSCIVSAVFILITFLLASLFPAAAFSRGTGLDFSNPPTAAKPMTRFWFPDAGAGGSEEGLALVRKQINEMVEDGFGGVEMVFLADNSDFSNAEAKTVGFGSKNWQNILKEVLRIANAVPGGFQIDLTITAHWPAIVNNIDPNDYASQQQLTFAYRKITAADLAKGIVDLPMPEQRTEDFSNTDNLIADFFFVDRYQAASVLKVIDLKNGEPVFEFASIIDASPQTAKKTVSDADVASGAAYKTENGVKYAGYAAGVPDFDTAWLRGMSYSKILAQWGPEPADKNLKGKIDEEGNRKRMADWQYLYQTDLSMIPELDSYKPGAGDELKVGDYVLFGTYSQGIGELMSGGSSVTEYNRSYATDLYNMKGTQAIEDFWDKYILDDELLSLLKENARQNASNALFEDSYEYHKTGQIWTEEALQAISEDHNYDARKYAAVYALTSAERRMMMGMGDDGGMPEGMGGAPEGGDSQEGAAAMGGAPGGGGAPEGQAAMGGASEGRGAQEGQAAAGFPGMGEASSPTPSFQSTSEMKRIMEDLAVSFGRLYRSAHVDGIRDFAGRFGYVYRAQIQAASVGVSGAEAGAGIQETDNRSGDPVRNMLGAANLNGSKIISSESITFIASDYGNTWKQLFTALNELMGSGVNRHIYHGVPFVEGFNGYGNAWPGWTFFLGRSGFGTFDRRQVYGENFYQFNGYVGRIQGVLQTGEAQVDLAILQGTDGRYSMPQGTRALQGLLDTGYSYNFIDEAMMELPSAKVAKGVLAANGPAYKALIVLNAEKMTVDGVDRLITYSKAGLPIILYDSNVTTVYGTEKPGYTDDIVTKRFAALKKRKKVSVVSSASQLRDALSSYKIESYARYEIPGVMANTRISGGDYYYTLYNEGISLQTEARAGDKGVRVSSTSNLNVGDRLVIDISGSRETVTVAGIDVSARSGPNVTLAAPLKHDHALKAASFMGMGSRSSGAPASFVMDKSITLTGYGTPYLLDPWTGKEFPVGEYTGGKGTVTFDIDLPAEEMLLFRVSAEKGADPVKHAVVSSGGDVLYKDGSTLVHRTDIPGNYDVEFSNGDKKTVTVREVPSEISLPDGWHLKLESWGPDPVANLGNPSLSKKTTISFSNVKLGNWIDLPATEKQLADLGVNDMSEVIGKGFYTKEFTLPSDWDSSVGAFLKLSHGEDIIVGVTANGQKLDPINQLSDMIDLSGYLKTGNNTITIEIATLMANRVEGRTKLAFGLSSVLLQPYVENRL